MEANEITADVSIDVSDLECPLLGLTAAKALTDMQPLQIIEVTSRNSGFKEPMRILAQRTGNELLGFSEIGGIHRSFIRKLKPLLGR